MSDGTVKVITVSWSEQVRRVASLTYDEARDAFGLGGTPDKDLFAKVELLCRQAPTVVSPAGNPVLQDDADVRDIRVVTGSLTATRGERPAADIRPPLEPGLYRIKQTGEYLRWTGQVWRDQIMVISGHSRGPDAYARDDVERVGP